MRIQDLCTEGSSAISDLCQLSEKLGYRDRYSHITLRDGSNLYSFINFLEDNPGAVESIYSWIEDNYSDELDSDLEEKVENIFSDSESTYDIRDSYSGRGMFGKKSKFAITTDADPESEIGLQLIGLGLSYDNMGKTDYVYYLKN